MIRIPQAAGENGSLGAENSNRRPVRDLHGIPGPARARGILLLTLSNSVKWVLATLYRQGETLGIWKLRRPYSRCHFCPTMDSAELLNPGLIFGHLMAPPTPVFCPHEVEDTLCYQWSNQGSEGQNSVRPTPPSVSAGTTSPCSHRRPDRGLSKPCDCVAPRPETS